MSWYGQYVKYGKRKAMEIATLGCAVRVKLSEDKTVIEDVRLAYGVQDLRPSLPERRGRPKRSKSG